MHQVEKVDEYRQPFFVFICCRSSPTRSFLALEDDDFIKVTFYIISGLDKITRSVIPWTDEGRSRESPTEW